MYKKALGVLALLNCIFFFGTVCVNGLANYNQGVMSTEAITKDSTFDKRLLATKRTNAIGIMNVAVSGQRVIPVTQMECGREIDLQENEMEILSRIVEAEAGNQDIEGKILVANVVLNRVENDKFPDNVEDVIMQQENGVSQFSPVSNGRIWSVCVSDQTKEAVERALSGEDLSEGALYFVARKYADANKMKWFDNHLTYLFEHGGHEFYK